ncbi:MAG: hypothetical protein RQ885_15225 [Desulfurococcales archaeon]|nr:hypothetical protein [Desulfurococcales archaeon]
MDRFWGAQPLAVRIFIILCDIEMPQAPRHWKGSREGIGRSPSF